jgi:type IV secretion system protein TrbC
VELKLQLCPEGLWRTTRREQQIPASPLDPFPTVVEDAKSLPSLSCVVGIPDLRQRHPRENLMAAAIGLFVTAPAFAQGNAPWENAVNVLQTSFTGPIAKGLGLVAIVVGGLTFAFGEGGGKRTFAGIVFGLGMAVLAVNFLSWLFGV